MADRLVEAREEVRKKSVGEVTPEPVPAEAASDSEQTRSKEPLIRQTTHRLVTPLHPEREEIIRQAARFDRRLNTPGSSNGARPAPSVSYPLLRWFR
jgi:hypothetical protein